MITTIIILSVILGISLFVNINQLTKQEAQAEYIEDLENSNTNFYTHFEQLKSKLNEANSEMRNVDRLGAFESSDEIGHAFKLIKEVIADLNKTVE